MKGVGITSSPSLYHRTIGIGLPRGRHMNDVDSCVVMFVLLDGTWSHVGLMYAINSNVL